MRKPLKPLITLLIFGVCCLSLTPATMAAGAGTYQALQDSLLNKASSEPTLQRIFDSLGYAINVAADETGIETWCALPGQNRVFLTAEVAGSGTSAKFGWYVASDSSVLHQLFSGSNVVGDSVSFTFSVGGLIGFYMKPGLSDYPTDVWFTQNSMSHDLFNHAKVFRNPGKPHEYLVAWEDLPNGGDQDWNDLVVRVRFANQAPVVTLPADSSVFQCSPAQICFPVKATDANCEGDTLTLVKVSGQGTFTTIKQKGPINATHCFTPPSAGVYQFIFKVTDELGATDFDTMNVTVTFNSPPVANAGRDSTLFQCTPAQICIVAGCTDPDGNLSTCQLVSGAATFNGSTICFTPATSGTSTFVLKATDACGAIDYDTSVVTVTLNSPPNIAFGNDTTLFQCTAAPICVTYSVSDPNGLSGLTEASVSGPGSIDTLNNKVCFTPATSGNYTIIAKVTDPCGVTDQDTVVVHVTLNSPPVANAGRDSTLFQCTPAQICIVAGCTDPDGNLSTCQLVSGAATFNGSTICFTPAASGTYTFVLKATDACGLIDYDTSVVNVTVNQAPVANAGRDSTLFQCSPAPICITAGCSDPDGNLSTCQLVSGTGTFNGSTICFTPPSSGTYSFVLKATDACGLIDYDTSVVNVTQNQPPVANAGRDSTLFQCSLAPICITAGCSDPDGNLSTCQLVSGVATFNGSTICFTPPSSGTYSFVLKATDACGLIDYDTSVVNVTLNQPPVANAGRDSTLFQCSPAQICIAAGCSDPDGNLSSCDLIPGPPGIFNGSSICFTPTGSGSFQFVLKATDACGLTDYDTLVINVTQNQPPVANAGRDSTLFQCTPAPICITAGCSDPDGNLSTCQLVSGSAIFNGSTICFTPATSGTYTFVLKATDACGLIDYDTSVVDVTLNQPPVANAGRDSTLFQCSLAPICITAGCTDPDGNLSTCQLVAGLGTLNGGGICFTPPGSGTYTFVVKATDACGATDYDTSVVQVMLNQPPVANAGRDSTLFQCSPAQICIAAGCSDPDGNLSTCQLIAALGTLNGGGICFTPPGSGTYTFIVKATDACGLIDYDTSVVNVTVNQAPVANAGRDSTLFQCTPAQICIAAGCTDPDGNLSTCQLIAALGTLNGGGICFTPPASGTYTFIVKATDACGLIDYDTSVVNVTLNQPPVADAGRDSTVSQCSPAQICIAAGCSDPDGNLSTCQLVSAPGTFDGSTICFTPASSGTYTFVLKATDACGATDFDTSVVTVALNHAPVANAGRDSTLFACAAQQICWAAGCSDPDNNLSTCELTSALGSFNGSQICFTPASSGSYTFVIKATDACGLTSFDTSVINVTINSAPVANAGADQNLNCQTPGQQICWNAGCSDIDGNLSTCALVSATGTYNGSQICFTPPSSGSYTFVLKATDACGATDYDTAVVTVRLNSAPSIAIDPSDTTIFCIQTGIQQICVPFTYSDPNNNVSTINASGSPAASVSYANGSGLLCFAPPSAGLYAYTLTVTDSCGLTGNASHNHGIDTINCDTTTCFIVKIEKTHGALQGHYEYVSIDIQGPGSEFGGFDFLLAYDNSALTPIDVQVGQLLTNCRWEYFTHRFGPFGNCGGPCPSGLLRIVSIADINNGANHPLCYGPAIASPGELFRVKFLVTNDRTFQCQYVPIRFYWIDCGDNGISSRSGDTLYIEKKIYTFDGQLLWDEQNDVQFPDFARPVGMGAPDFCMLGQKYHPVRCIEFWHGGVDIVCADSIDARGDLNLNGIANEIADAVLYTNYFLYGSAALDPDPRLRESQIAASDINVDGVPLTVGDLVYLVRIITGDALPFAKLSPFAQSVSLRFEGNVLSTESNVNLGALLLTFKVSDDYAITNLTNMTVDQNVLNGELKVLVYDISTRSIAAGLSPIISVKGNVELVSVEAADYNGNMMSAKLEASSVPTQFTLNQNYPNPFNPETIIEFALPSPTEITLRIFNVAGQTVTTLVNGMMPAGYHQVRWNGRDANGNIASSGIYLYKIESKTFTETRKMILVK